MDTIENEHRHRQAAIGQAVRKAIARYYRCLARKPAEKIGHLEKLAFELVEIFLGNAGKQEPGRGGLENVQANALLAVPMIAQAIELIRGLTDEDRQALQNFVHAEKEAVLSQAFEREWNVTALPDTEPPSVANAAGHVSAINPAIHADPGAMIPGREYPRWMYHAQQQARTVSDPREEAGLGDGWSRWYIHQEYPKVKHHFSGKMTTVKNAVEEAELGGGWASSVNAFDRYKGPRSPTSELDPERWVDDWTVLGLLPEHRTKIKAHLSRVDSAFWAEPDAASADVTAMRASFDGIAGVLFEARLLSDDLLENEIPLLAWESAIAAGWWRLGSEIETDMFPEKIGRYFVWREQGGDWRDLFRPEYRKWRGALLEESAFSDKSAQSTTLLTTNSSEAPSWNDLGRQFELYALEYDDLAGDVDPLRPGRWGLIRAVSPRAERLFKEIGGRAAVKAAISPPDDKTEPWQLWLEFMWSRGWRNPETPPKIQSIQRRIERKSGSWSAMKARAEAASRTLPGVFQTSADCCRDLAEQEEGSSPKGKDEALPGTSEPEPNQIPDDKQKAAANRRKSIVMPILTDKGWSPSKWITQSGVGKNTVYKYLDGERDLRPDSRKAMAEALGLKPEQLPD